MDDDKDKASWLHWVRAGVRPELSRVTDALKCAAVDLLLSLQATTARLQGPGSPALHLISAGTQTRLATLLFTLQVKQRWCAVALLALLLAGVVVALIGGPICGMQGCPVKPKAKVSSLQAHLAHITSKHARFHQRDDLPVCPSPMPMLCGQPTSMCVMQLCLPAE